MASTYQIIDQSIWKRATHCQIFRDYVEPCFCITLELDITNYLKKVKEKQLSFTFAMVHCVTKCAKEQKAYFTGPLANDVFQLSPIPWISYTHISHTNSGKKDCATPLFDWGKFYEKDGRVLLLFSIQAHHSFVDGVHVGKLVNTLQAYLNAF